jgi:hypothetical protein
MCLPQVIKSFQNYRGVATTFYPTLVKVIFVFPGSIIISRMYQLTPSHQVHVTLQRTASLSDRV